MASVRQEGVAHARLSQRIRDTVTREIVSGQLEPGKRLVETTLAARFGTSQTPVREALRELEALGMVENRPRRGTFVVSFVQQTLQESYIVRAALEETATRLVLATEALPFADLEASVEAMDRAASRVDADGVAAATVEFHRKIIVAASNDMLTRAWEGLQIAARTSVVVTVTDPDLQDIADSHRALLCCFAGGDVERACRAAREHQWHYARLDTGA